MLQQKSNLSTLLYNVLPTTLMQRVIIVLLRLPLDPLMTWMLSPALIRA